MDPKVLHRAKQNDLSVLPQMWALIIDLLKLDQAPSLDGDGVNKC